MTIYELDNSIISDELELGMRVAVAFYADNKTDLNNRRRIILHRVRMGKINGCKAN